MSEIATKWYADPAIVRSLPLRYRAYALYSRGLGESASRRVPGGSFLLRALRRAGKLAGLSSVVQISTADGLVVVTDFADERVLEVIHEIRGENPEYRVMRSLLSAGDTFVDVGANFGTFSLLASRLVGAGGKVIAIEPQPRLADFIRESVRLSFADNCEVRQVAGGKETGESTLFVPVNDSGRAGLFPTFSARASHQPARIYVSPLDSIVRGVTCPGRMVIKIDVEGSEAAVLEGARDTIASRRPPILIELNPWSAKAAGTAPAELIDLLSELGYRSFATMSSFPGTIERAEIPLDRQINLLALQ